MTNHYTSYTVWVSLPRVAWILQEALSWLTRPSKLFRYYSIPVLLYLHELCLKTSDGSLRIFRREKREERREKRDERREKREERSEKREERTEKREERREEKRREE